MSPTWPNSEHTQRTSAAPSCDTDHSRTDVMLHRRRCDHPVTETSKEHAQHRGVCAAIDSSVSIAASSADEDLDVEGTVRRRSSDSVADSSCGMAPMALGAWPRQRSAHTLARLRSIVPCSGKKGQFPRLALPDLLGIDGGYNEHERSLLTQPLLLFPKYRVV